MFHIIFIEKYYKKLIDELRAFFYQVQFYICTLGQSTGS